MNIEFTNHYIEDTVAVESIPSLTLLERMPALVRRERAAAAAVIAHLLEIDRRQLYLDEACSSLYTYCMERLGYSEDEALRRVRVARLAARFPQVLDELRSGAIHLTGLFLLSRYVTPENIDALLAEARGKSRSELQELVARWFPRSDVAQRVEPLVGGPGVGPATCAGTGTGAPYRVEPLSPSRYLVQFTASSELHQKITQARELLSHVLPSGDLAALFERAIDVLLKREVRRRMGVAGVSRKRGGTASASAPETAEPSNVGAHAMAPRATGAAAGPTEPVAHTATERRSVTRPSSTARASATTAETSLKQETAGPGAVAGMAATPTTGARATTAPAALASATTPQDTTASATTSAMASIASATALAGASTASVAGARASATTMIPLRTTSRSRYVPLAVARAVWERDGGQCTFVNGEGRRCQERRFMTLEHREPHALGGEASVSNLCLLCRSHNVHAGRRLFGERHARRRRRPVDEHDASATTDETVLRGLCGLGFRERDARRALAEVRGEIGAGGGNGDASALLRAAVLRLTGGASRRA